MTLPQADTPLYDHPLPEIEQWLTDLGCQQDQNEPHCWQVEKAHWKAELCLDVEDILVSYLNEGKTEEEINRSFPYSLSRADVEAAIFSGP